MYAGKGALEDMFTNRLVHTIKRSMCENGIGLLAITPTREWGTLSALLPEGPSQNQDC